MNLYSQYGLTLEEGNEALLKLVSCFAETLPSSEKTVIDTISKFNLTRKQIVFCSYLFCTKPYELGVFARIFKDKAHLLGKEAAIQYLESSLNGANQSKLEDYLSKNN